MSKKSRKIAATYFVTIISSILIIGGAGYYFFNSYMNDSEDSKIKPVESMNTQVNEEYVPSFSECKTVLAIYAPEKKMTASCFVLVRFIPTECKTVIVPLQSDICTTLDGKTNTLYEFYRLGGTSEAVRAVEEATAIKIDKYIRFTKDSFTMFSNLMGNISFNIPYNMVYENPDTAESTVLKSGQQTLDSVTLRKVLTYPNYKGGEEYRAKIVGEIAMLLINSGSNGILQEGLESTFNDIVNSDAETNITRYDFDEVSDAMEYQLDNNSSPAQLVIPSGSYNENNCYVLDDSFVNALPNWFSLE